MPRGSKPGERRGGRKPGVPNKATASLKGEAQQYTSKALRVLAAIMLNMKSPPAARVAAANSLLDRGYGKPPQALTGADDKPLMPPATVYELHLPEGKE